MNVLYVSYDGALDPLGQSQVVPYVRGLSERGHDMTLLSFEKRAGVLPGVRWKPMRYHAGFSPLTTSYDLARGYAWALAQHALRPFDLVHARSYPGCLLAWWLHKSVGVPYIFDVRGFYPEERVDGGLWPKDGALFRLTKRLERVFDRDAAAVVTLTHASVAIIEERVRRAGGRASVHMIPTCVDLQRFRREPGPRRPLELAYVGSLGTWYMLDEMLAFARVAQRRDPQCHIRFVTNERPERVPLTGLDPARCTLQSVPFAEVSRALEHTSAAFFFITPSFSKIASAPTKLGEALALGLPCVINAGVGDSQALIEQHEVGVVVSDFAALDAAFSALETLLADTGVEQRCRALAESFFSLDRGVDAYARIYASVSTETKRSRHAARE